jgi:Gpi18-like mannosyltransferase
MLSVGSEAVIYYVSFHSILVQQIPGEIWEHASLRRQTEATNLIQAIALCWFLFICAMLYSFPACLFSELLSWCFKHKIVQLKQNILRTFYIKRILSYILMA